MRFSLNSPLHQRECAITLCCRCCVFLVLRKREPNDTGNPIKCKILFRVRHGRGYHFYLGVERKRGPWSSGLVNRQIQFNVKTSFFPLSTVFFTVEIMAFTFVAFCYLLAMLLAAVLIFFAIFHVSIPTFIWAFSYVVNVVLMQRTCISDTM